MSPAPLDPRFARAFALHQQGRLDEAFAGYDAVLRERPDHAPALHYSALVLHVAGHHEAALGRLQYALALDPSPADAWSNLALVQQALGRLSEALDAHREATRRAPGDPALWLNLAATLLDAGLATEAETAARRALELDSGAALAWYNLGLALDAQRRVDEAVSALQRARTLAPGEPAVIGALAAAQASAEGPDAAIATLEAALGATTSGKATRPPASPALAFQLAGLHERRGDLVRARELYGRLPAATGWREDGAATLSQLLFLTRRLCEWETLPALRSAWRAAVSAGASYLSPFALLAEPSTRAEQLACARAWSAGVAGRTPAPMMVEVGAGARASPGAGAPSRLRVAYLSADFHTHATALLTAGLFEQHDRARVEVLGYSTGPDDGSALGARVRKAFDGFVDAHGWPTQALVRRIRDDAPDLLIDLKGHTEGAPFAVLAQRPAKVQATWLGYPGTTGSDAIDYLLGDAVVTPFAHAADYAETLVQLPGCYQVNDRSRVVGSPPSRAELGLPDGAFVLASFNASYKTGPEVLDAWARILEAVPRALLWILLRAEERPAAAHLRRALDARGIDPERLVVAGSRPNAEYLGLYTRADLALDPWPYNGHTTTSDALWAGCPVLTLLGETFAGRVAASLVTAVGLPELIAPDVDGYVGRAIAAARDPSELARWRSHLAGAGRASGLFDVAKSARALERAYVLMIEQAATRPRSPIVVPG